ncbi:UDP-glucuronosyltransferase 1A1 [Latimeria chalumnae]|uniref:glucuronosyltransferase n=1 Tax=Latimeria chalumnae TaxID=7897 RepID=H3B0G4_LATCH|nr:PREDICTED: UDP-glucuronosyltransferase 1-1 isoform X1 [Latimeria chalumnae]|eukprot:XP_005996000.1 PREDICTED: UDP-glucuronosyltransferase 1-1 isoform X1 [Latimeria chalumnae]
MEQLLRKMDLTFNSHFSLLSCLLLMTFQSLFGPGDCGKLLVVPVDGSHWLSMQPVSQQLGQRGHTVVVVTPRTSLLISPSQHYSMKYYPVPYGRADLDAQFKSMNENLFDQTPRLGKITTTYRRFRNVSKLFLTTCEHLLYNQELMASLRQENFDAVLTDPIIPCGLIVAEYLSLPLVTLLRGLPCSMEYRASQCPAPPSYVPRIFTGHTDRMTFLQRMKNLLTSFAELSFCQLFYGQFDGLAAHFLQKDTSVLELLSHTSIWLMQYDFVFEYPRPLMPNMIMVGGLNCGSAKALPQELEDFVNSSGEHGIVVFSLGSMLSEIPLEKAMQISEAFNNIPQKVLWRYAGPTPPNLGKNIKLMKWLPQNDLLAHPKTRVFVTHGGINGIYEAICHGVPLVMLPLFGDQADNSHHMQAHGAGIILNIFQMTSRDLLAALNAVISDVRYKENMLRLSTLHKDRPIEPLHLAVHWVEFVMKHKGAKHLWPAAHELNWFQYHCLDVIGLLVAATGILLYVVLRGCCFCWRRCLCKKTTRKPKSE